MIKNLKSSVILTLLLLLLLGFGYTFVLWGVGRIMPEKSNGSPLISGGKIIGYENIGQSFTAGNYFQGRPSAVGYNAASTGGSNKGPSNPDYLAEVQARIDTFLVYNPGVKKEETGSSRWRRARWSSCAATGCCSGCSRPSRRR